MGSLLKGERVNGIKSPWDISKQRAIGTDDNPNGSCRIEKHAKLVDLKQFGVKIGNKKQLYLHQAAYAYEYGHLPRNEHVVGPPKKKRKKSKKKKKKTTSTQPSTTLVIAHNCGRWNCSVPRHMDIVPNADNLIHVRCHDDLRMQNRSNCFSGTNETYGLGRDCWDRHAGLRCHYNFSNGPDTKASNQWRARKRTTRDWEL